MTPFEYFQLITTGPAYLFSALVGIFGLIYLIPGARYLHGTDIHWEELGMTPRAMFIIIGCLCCIVPVLNLLFALYIVTFFVVGYIKRRRHMAKLHADIMDRGRQAMQEKEMAYKLDVVPIAANEPGAHAMIVMDTGAHFSRPEELMERYLQKVVTHIHERFCVKIGVMPYLPQVKAKKAIEALGEAKVQELWSEVLMHYRRLSPKTYEFFANGEYNQSTPKSLMKRVDMMADIVYGGFLIMPPDEAFTNTNAYAREIHRYYPDVV